jgi:hypothetical protein
VFCGAEHPCRCCPDASILRSTISDVHPFLGHAHRVAPGSSRDSNSFYRHLEAGRSTTHLGQGRQLCSGFPGVSAIKLSRGHSHLGEANEALLGGLHTLDPVHWYRIRPTDLTWNPPRAINLIVQSVPWVPIICSSSILGQIYLVRHA